MFGVFEGLDAPDSFQWPFWVENLELVVLSFALSGAVNTHSITSPNEHREHKG